MKTFVMKLSLVATCAVALSGAVQAQTKMEWGIKGDIGLANLTGDVTGISSTLSVSAGGLARFSVSSQFSIQPELSLVLKGAKGDEADDDKLKLTYLEVPVLLMYRPLTTGTMKPAFFAGPAIGLLLSAKSGADDFKDNVNGTDFGFVFGAGADFVSAGKSRLSVDGRYTMGISNIAKDAGDDSVKNGVFSFGVRYIFSLGQ